METDVIGPIRKKLGLVGYLTIHFGMGGFVKGKVEDLIVDVNGVPVAIMLSKITHTGRSNTWVPWNAIQSYTETSTNEH